MALDPTKHADWEIAEEAEARMKTVYQLGEELGLEKEELLPHGHYVAKLDFNRVLKRLEGKSDAKYIDVTAITPTPSRFWSVTSVGIKWTTTLSVSWSMTPALPRQSTFSPVTGCAA
ncbi:MAG: formate--tetrahydrofolate ligase [Candidatus Sulfobium sp.]